MSKKADRGKELFSSNTNTLSQITALFVFLVERTGPSGGGVWALLETHPHSCWSMCDENIPEKPKYLGEALREAAMEKKGKENLHL